MKYTLKEKKPKCDQIIVFKAKNMNLPEIGIWSDFEDNPSEIYIPANDDVELIENIEWWMELPL
jgi:hypothetical protein